MSNGKRFILEEAVALAYDDSTILLYPLTAREAIMLLGQIEFIGWQTRWVNQSFTQAYLDAKVASIADGLMNPQNIMNCNDIMDCVDTSNTIGQIAINNRANRNASIIQVNKFYNSIYNGTPTSINSSVPVIWCDGQQTTVNKMCYAVRFFVEEYRLTALDSARARLTYTYIAIGVTALATAFAGIIGYIIGGSIIGVIASYTIPQTEAFITALENVNIDEIVCDIVNYLNLKTVNQTTFTASLTGITVTGNADILADALTTDNATLAGYLRFLDILGTTISTGSILTDPCACAPLGWTKTFNFLVGTEGLTFENGTYVSGSGIQLQNVGNSNFYIILRIPFTFATNVSNATVTYNWVTVRQNAGITHYSRNPTTLVYIPQGDIVPIAGIQTSNQLMHDQGDGYALWVRQSSGNDAYLRTLTLTGTGVSPF